MSLEGGNDDRWRVTRAKEQDVLEGVPQAEIDASHYLSLINKKEAMRQASNAAEAAVMALTEVQAVADLVITDFFAPGA